MEISISFRLLILPLWSYVLSQPSSAPFAYTLRSTQAYIGARELAYHQHDGMGPTEEASQSQNQR
jgi:hypothetical protein